MTVPYRKRSRLDSDHYSELGSIWFSTTNTRKRMPVFHRAEMAHLAVETLLDQSTKRGLTLLHYCVMPDHIHILAQVNEGNLIAFVGAFKSIVAIEWNARGNDGKLWQRSFHDSGVRRPEDMAELIAYILANPVEEKLAAAWQEYRWISGSLLEDS